MARVTRYDITHKCIAYDIDVITACYNIIIIIKKQFAAITPMEYQHCKKTGRLVLLRLQPATSRLRDQRLSWS